jgi:acyl dehydratase
MREDDAADGNAGGGLDSEAVAVGDEAPGFTVEALSIEDFVRYAGASGDFNRLHYDEAFAKRSGQDGVIAQGMLLAGYASRLVTDWLGHRYVRSFTTQFEAAVGEGEAVTVAGEVVDVTHADGETTVEVTVTVDGDDATALTGTATAIYPAAEPDP